MPQLRRAAWAVVATTLLATMSFAGTTGIARAGVAQCTGWTDDYHPPTTVRVRRSSGPNAGRVEVVPFWNYVAVVLRIEYGTGLNRPPLWLRMGAVTVKQFAWYYAGHWRGGNVIITNPDGSTTTECYDLKDTTVDQLYKPEKADPNNPGQWIPANVPSPANLKAMRETWHMTFRKWQATKNQSRLYLTGYRSGYQRPCGADSTGFRIFQKSLRDCGVKAMTFEETQREYFEPNHLLVDTRSHDMQADADDWRGDLGVLTPGTGAWRLYMGSVDGFTAGPTGSFGSIGTVLGQGVGNVDSADSNGANDTKLLADLIMLVNNGGRKLLTARATTNGFAAPLSQAAPAGSEQLLVADFNGDLLADAGLLSPTSTAGVGKLVVMRSMGNGTFSDPVDWWTGPLDLAASVELAGDANGDGKADLIMRDAAGVYSVAASSASCSDLTVWGVCPAVAVAAVGLASSTVWLSSATWAATDVKNLVGDYDRDGRDDVVAVVKDGTGIKVFGLRSRTDGTFADHLQLWQSGSVAFADVQPMTLNVNPDGMADLALFQKDGSNTKVWWLRTVERSSVPASMTPAGAAVDAGTPWNTGNRPF